MKRKPTYQDGDVRERWPYNAGLVGDDALTPWYNQREYINQQLPGLHTKQFARCSDLIDDLEDTVPAVNNRHPIRMLTEENEKCGPAS